MGELSVLFLPSGPGLSSGPAQVFLADVLSARGKTTFWEEPSVARGGRVPADPRALWDSLFESMTAAVDAFGGDYVIVTESFGSLLAEEFARRCRNRASGKRPLGLLHTPPVMDLREAYRTILRRVEKREDAEAQALDFSTPEFRRALDDAFADSELLPSYFSSRHAYAKWLGGFTGPGKAPDAAVRDALLAAVERTGAATAMRFDSEAPTWVCIGGKDPYAPARFRPATGPERWIEFADSRHYPFVDEPTRWRVEVLDPFLSRVRRS
jgi:hypothetical protein